MLSPAGRLLQARQQGLPSEVVQLIDAYLAAAAPAARSAEAARLTRIMQQQQHTSACNGSSSNSLHKPLPLLQQLILCS
jgi:hypothetical protein